MRVMVIPADRGGCGHYRLIWPAQAVAAARPDWQVDIVAPEAVRAGFRGDQFVGVEGFPDPLPDVLVMQRIGTPGQYQLFRWASQAGIATVLDFDDAMWCIDEGNAAWRSWNLRNPWDQHWRTCDEAAKVADLVTVTTEALARHYGKSHGRTEVVPNCVPHAATVLDKSENETFTAGWAGFTKTHPGDCKVSAPAARAVLDAGGALRVVADGFGAAIEWGVDPDLVDDLGPRPLGPRYYSAIGRLDLMLVGLRDTPFNRGKSALKVLEAASQGVPSIAPDNPPHRALARTGFPVTLASTPGEWADHAKWHALMPEDERRELRGAVQAYTQDHWTIEANAGRWAEAWERAYRRKNA
jgi:glycosyltransferase involved in cell wall biosynthesis